MRDYDLPEIVATPSSGEVRSRDEISMDEEIDYDLVSFLYLLYY